MFKDKCCTTLLILCHLKLLLPLRFSCLAMIDPCFEVVRQNPLCPQALMFQLQGQQHIEHQPMIMKHHQSE